MVAVFGAFALSPEVFLKLIGIGLATAILVDATIVRMVLVPAVMQLLGERNWWLPRWLDRLIPAHGARGAGPQRRPARQPLEAESMRRARRIHVRAPGALGRATYDQPAGLRRS